jgi:hypothetical protein
MRKRNEREAENDAAEVNWAFGKLGCEDQNVKLCKLDGCVLYIYG